MLKPSQVELAYSIEALRFAQKSEHDGFLGLAVLHTLRGIQ